MFDRKTFREFHASSWNTSPRFLLGTNLHVGERSSTQQSPIWIVKEGKGSAGSKRTERKDCSGQKKE
jgi:hypothetical protein